MKRQEVLNQIRDQFVRLVTSVRAARALHQLDLNIVLEDVVCPVLRVTHDLPGLRNLNEAERANFPGLDLGDAERGVGVQVTATADAKKIRDTIGTCIRHGVFERYPRLLIYVLGERQAKYRIDVSADTRDLVAFDPDSDVLDYRDLLRLLVSRPIEDLNRVLEIVKAELGTLPPDTPVHDGAEESVWLNLLPITLPDELFIAELVPDARAGSARRNERAAAKDHLDDLGSRFAVDWSVHGGQLFTFHDLSNRQVPLSRLVDAGTVTCLEPFEYFGIGLGYENAFKDLLRRVLQQKLYHRGVRWQHQEALFIFSTEADDTLRRSESWFGSKAANRRVYEQVPRKDDPEEVYHCKHLAFGASFHLVDSDWYLGIKPEWFFSWDGYRKWPFGADSIEWLKRNERNQHVFNHLKFLAYFLTHDPPPDLFRDFTPYPFLGLGELVTFSGAPSLPDQEWQSVEDEEARRSLTDPLQGLPLFGDTE